MKLINNPQENQENEVLKTAPDAFKSWEWIANKNGFKAE